MKKKILSFLVAICLLLPCAFMLAACDKGDKTAKVMTLELNPEIEFVLDKDDKVVTVNALNEDGNAIITATANVDYTTLTAEQAAELFIKTAKDQGFIIEGTADEISISISGEDANKLYNSVKNSMSSYLQSVNITNISFEELEKIDKEDLVDAVEECYREYSESQLKEMTEEELVAMLETSRKETATFVSEELKELYYTMREETLRAAKLEALSTSTNSLLTQYKDQIKAYKDEFIATYLNPESDYNKELKAFVDAKKELLADNLSGETLTAAQETFNQAKTALGNKFNEVKVDVETALNNVESFVDDVESAISAAIQLVPELANTVNTKVNEALTALKAEFTTGDLAQYNVSHWAETQPAT